MSSTVGSVLATICLGYLVLTTAALVAMLIWALRSGHFRDQQRARYLPLLSPPTGAASGDHASPTDEEGK